MLISVIIPAYNAQNYILKSLNSVYIQEKENVEIVVVDDGSTDNTKSIVECFIKEHTDISIKLVSIANGGLANARNVGIQNAKGDYFINLDADDYLRPGIIALLVQKHEEQDFDVCFYGMEDIDERDGSVLVTYSDKFAYVEGGIGGKEAFKKKGTRQIWICQGSACYKKSIVFEHELYNIPGLNQGEDYYFIMSFLLYAKKVTCIPQIGVSILFRRLSMMHATFNESHLQVFELLDRLLLNPVVQQENELKRIVHAEWDVNRLAIAKKIITQTNVWHPHDALRAFKAYIPCSKQIEKGLLGRKKKIELFLFHKMPLAYFVCSKLYMWYRGDK